MYRRSGLQALRNALRAARVSSTITSTAVRGPPSSADLARGFSSFLGKSLSGANATVNPGFAVGALRHFAKGAKTNSLTKALDAEISDQEETYEPVKPKIPHGFKVVEDPGNKKLKLRRTFGNEEVELVTYIDPELDAYTEKQNYYDPEEGEDGEDGEGAGGAPFSFMVTVTKPGDDRSLVFDCTLDADELMIDGCRMEDPKVPEQDAYGGPEYGELDERLTEGFKKYLEERGITRELLEACVDLKNDKEEREYGRWLKEVKSFVS